MIPTEIAGEHIVTECTDQQAFVLLEPDTIILVKVERLSATVAEIFGLMLDFHYQSDHETTVNKAPDFNVLP